MRSPRIQDMHNAKQKLKNGFEWEFCRLGNHLVYARSNTNVVAQDRTSARKSEYEDTVSRMLDKCSMPALSLAGLRGMRWFGENM